MALHTDFLDIKQHPFAGKSQIRHIRKGFTTSEPACECLRRHLQPISARRFFLRAGPENTSGGTESRPPPAGSGYRSHARGGAHGATTKNVGTPEGHRRRRIINAPYVMCRCFIHFPVLSSRRTTSRYRPPTAPQSPSRPAIRNRRPPCT